MNNLRGDELNITLDGSRINNAEEVMKNTYSYVQQYVDGYVKAELQQINLENSNGKGMINNAT